MTKIQKMRPLAFKLVPWEFFKKSVILSKINENDDEDLKKMRPQTSSDRQ